MIKHYSILISQMNPKNWKSSFQCVYLIKLIAKHFMGWLIWTVNMMSLKRIWMNIKCTIMRDIKVEAVKWIVDLKNQKDCFRIIKIQTYTQMQCHLVLGMTWTLMWWWITWTYGAIQTWTTICNVGTSKMSSCSAMPIVLIQCIQMKGSLLWEAMSAWMLSLSPIVPWRTDTCNLLKLANVSTSGPL